MEKLKLGPPTPEEIEAIKPFFYEIYPWAKELDDMKDQLARIRFILKNCHNNKRYILVGGIFNWPLLVQDIQEVLGIIPEGEKHE